MSRNLRVQAARLLTVDRQWSARVARAAASHPLAYRASVILAHAGDGLFCLAVGLLVLLAGSRDHRNALLQIAASVLAAAALAAGVKFSVRRERPQGTDSTRWSAMSTRDPYSFPSGHAARAACIATGVSVLYPAATWPCMVWAAGVCLARVTLAAHYLLDVLVGVVLGALVARLMSGVWPSLLLFYEGLPL